MTKIRKRAPRALVLPLLFASVVLASLTPIALAPIPAHAAWYNPSYLNKKSVTIDHTKVGLPAFDQQSVNSASGSPASPWTPAPGPIVGTGSNRLLLVTLEYNSTGAATTAVTFSGAAMTHVPGAPKACTATCEEDMWYLVAPASGTHPVVVTFTGSPGGINIGASSYTDVNQTTPLGNIATFNGTSANMSNTNPTTVANQLVVDSFAALVGATYSSQAQTLNFYSNPALVPVAGSSYRKSAGTSTPMTWVNASTTWAQIIATINPVDQANFPVLVQEASDASLATVANGGSVQNASGFDIIFTDSTETTKLDHEIDHYVPTTGEIEMWVRIPILSAAVDTVIYMYYDNASISTSQENKTGVWDANYGAVWHEGETTLPQHDSTTNANDLITDSGIAGRGTATGQIGPADSFNGTATQEIDTSTTTTNLSGPDLTVSAWFKLTQLPSVAGIGEIIVQHQIIASRWRLMANSSNNIEFQFLNSSATLYVASGATTLTTGTWYHATGTYDSTKQLLNVFLNGTRDNAAPIGTTGTLVVASTAAGLGYAAANGYYGSIDEVRVSKSLRSGGWIATEYNDQSSPSTFLTFGATSGTAGQTVTQTINAGSLSVTAPGPATLAAQNPGSVSGAAQALGALTFTDTLNDSLAWSVTMAATDFGAGKIPFTGLTIGVTTAGNYTGSPGNAGAPGAGTASQTLAGTDTIAGVTYSNSITLVTAAGLNGVEGTWTTPAGAATGNTIIMVVPATTTGGPYSSTVQYTIAG